MASLTNIGCLFLNSLLWLKTLADEQYQLARLREDITITFRLANCGENFEQFTLGVLIGAVGDDQRLQRLDKIYTKREIFADDDPEQTFRISHPLIRSRFGEELNSDSHKNMFKRKGEFRQCVEVNDGRNEYFNDFNDGIKCFRRADVIYIDFYADMPGDLALEDLIVEINSRAVLLTGQIVELQSQKFEHPIIIPCIMTMNHRAIYKIGPNFETFTTVDGLPLIGDFIDG